MPLASAALSDAFKSETCARRLSTSDDWAQPMVIAKKTSFTRQEVNRETAVNSGAARRFHAREQSSGDCVAREAKTNRIARDTRGYSWRVSSANESKESIPLDAS